MKITNKIDNVTLIPPSSMYASSPAPKSVKIEITSSCNLKCVFCTSHKNERAISKMPLGDYKTLVTELFEYGVEEIGLFYLGESLLHPDISEMVRFTKQLGFKWVFLTTNGLLADREMTRSLMKAGLDSLKFSLNYGTEDQFAEITQVSKRKFRTIVQNIKEAFTVREEKNFKCIVSASSVLYGVDQKEIMDPLLIELSPYLDEHYWLPLYSSAGESETVAPGNTGRLDAPRPSLPCWTIFNAAHISTDGNVSACSFDYDGRFKMGNINEKPFSECWNSSKFQELREKHLSGDVRNSVCSKCIHRE